MARFGRYLNFAIAAGLVCPAAWVGTRFYLRQQFVSLLEDLRKLDASQQPTAFSAELMKKYANNLAGTHSERNYTATSFVFRNRALSVLRLAPATEIEIKFEQEGTSLRNIAIVYTSAVFKENSPILYVSELFCTDPGDPWCSHFAMNPHGKKVTQTWNADVSFGQLARPEIRDAVLSLNPGCFVNRRGCTDVSELLPTLWKVASPGTVSSRLRSDSDSLAERSEPLD